MPNPLSAVTIQLVKATVPALEAHGVEITRRMYERLFQDASIKELFNQSHHGAANSSRKPWPTPSSLMHGISTISACWVVQWNGSRRSMLP